MAKAKRESYAQEDNAGRITEEGVERMRARIGVEMPKQPWQTWNEYASVDAFRHFAYGFGDDNPLWIDREYGAKTRWRSAIAPPTFPYSMGVTQKKEITEEERGRGGGALKGVHAFWSGDEVEWLRPIFPGDRLVEQRTHLWRHTNLHCVSPRRPSVTPLRTDTYKRYHVFRVFASPPCKQ